jgi:hypothetical protein
LDPAYGPYNRAEMAAAHAAGVPYIDPTPWFCSTDCSPIIGPFDVYFDKLHITSAYGEYLSTVLGQALFAARPS